MTVLVIDDEEDIRLLARAGLSASGLTVVTAAGGSEGLQLARDERPAAILLDMMMPGMDGAATFSALRADPATAAIPVLFLTAKTRARLDPGLLDQPRVGLLDKPFVPRDLAGIIRGFLASLPQDPRPTPHAPNPPAKD